MLKMTEGSRNNTAFRHIIGADDLARHAIRKWLYDTGKDLMASFNKAVLAKPRAGREYISRDRRGRRRRHTASRAGESPANRTGFYRKSADFVVRGHQELLFGVEAEYGAFLELGTKRMAARPGLGNAVRASERNTNRRARNYLERNLSI